MKNNFKPYKTILISLIFIFIILLIVGISSSFFFLQYPKINCLQDISTCYAFDELKTDNIVLKDKYIGKLNYVDSYCYKLNYDNIDFKIYAYEFKNIDNAIKYCYQVNGKTTEGDVDYLRSAGLFSSSLIVRYNTNVYRIQTNSARDLIKIQHYLNSIFSVTIR